MSTIREHFVYTAEELHCNGLFLPNHAENRGRNRVGDLVLQVGIACKLQYLVHFLVCRFQSLRFTFSFVNRVSVEEDVKLGSRLSFGILGACS